MSYILDALRRLEQDKEKARMTANPIRAVLQGGGASERPPREGWRGRTHWPWVPTGLLLLFLALGVTFWVARSTAPVTKEAGPALPSLPPAAAARGPSPDAGVSSVKGPEPSRLWTGAGEAPASTVPGLSPLPASPPPDRVRIPSLPADAPAVPTVMPAARSPAGSAPLPEEVLVAEPEPVRDPGSASASPRRAPQPAPAQRLSEPPPTRLSAGETGLRISAIVWSPNRENRFAVVNMKTVHEGDFVDDDKVLEIGEDEVIFEKEGRRFSVGVGKR